MKTQSFFRLGQGLCTRQVPRHLPALLQDRCKWRQWGDGTVDPTVDQCQLQMQFGTFCLCKILKSHLKWNAVVHAETNQLKSRSSNAIVWQVPCRCPWLAHIFVCVRLLLKPKRVEVEGNNSCLPFASISPTFVISTSTASWSIAA